jgi:predicted DsbA family dithiol-disulfide isomerase
MQNEGIAVRPARSAGSRVRGPLAALAVAASLALLSACAREGAASARAASGADLPETLAVVGGSPLTLADLRPRVGAQLDQLESQYLLQRSTLIERALEETLRERLIQAEAQRQGKTIDELIAAEAGPGGFEPNEIEIAAWYADNSARVGGRSLDEVRPQIAELLRAERRAEAEHKLNERITREQQVAIHFEPYRMAMDNRGSPYLGREGAPVTIVEFSDFQCPFCARFAPTLKRLADNFGSDVHVVYRQYPILSIHPQAFKASEASLCAHEQGKFWEMHDLMFAEQNSLTVAELKAMAGRLGLNQRRFDSCLDSGKYVEQVQRDMQEGERLGIRGTPAVFVNGVAIPGGAVPYETVAAAVERELNRVRRQ